MAEHKYYHFPSVSITNGNIVKVKIDYDEIEGRVGKAQLALDMQVMIDMEPIMPRQTGMFVDLTKARSIAEAGSGKVYAAAPPCGRFLYFGKVMVDPVTRSPFARAGVKKVVTDRDLKFWYPGAKAIWFEVAKQQRLNDWIRLVNNIMLGEQK